MTVIFGFLVGLTLPAGTPTMAGEPGTVTITGIKWQDKVQHLLSDPGPDGIRQVFGGDGIEGTPDDEIALPGWTVELWDVTGVASLSGFTTTDSAGNYRFESLQPGLSYAVRLRGPRAHFSLTAKSWS
jgi:hypothetical protein